MPTLWIPAETEQTVTTFDPGMQLGDVYEVEPLKDPRWAEFVREHPRSSVFHSVPWLKALHRTYGYKPVVYTLTPPDSRLDSGLVLCRVTSRLTGRRLISLPFSDHCEPLVKNHEDEQVIVSEFARALLREKAGYAEVRANHSIVPPAGLYSSVKRCCLHKVDLQPDVETLFSNVHKSSTQRKIVRARREGVSYESGNSRELLEVFWKLFLITRRRHQAPPPSIGWFRNLLDCFGTALQIRVAFKGKQPLAAMLTLRHNDVLVYKYGGSDPMVTSLGGMQFLFWETIQEAKKEGVRVLDLGRTEWDQEGLLMFKDRLGGVRSNLEYFRFSASPHTGASNRGAMQWVDRNGRRIVSYLPDWAFSKVGSALYKHIA